LFLFNICFQKLTANTFSIASITAGDIYISDQSMLCQFNPTISPQQPNPFVDPNPPPFLVPIGEAPTFMIDVFNFAPLGAQDFDFTITTILPTGVTLNPVTGSVPASNGDQFREIAIEIDTSQQDGAPFGTVPQSFDLQIGPLQSHIQIIPFQASKPIPPNCSDGTNNCVNPSYTPPMTTVVQDPPFAGILILVMIGLVLVSLFLKAARAVGSAKLIPITNANAMPTNATLPVTTKPMVAAP
jgi:hypothetical protein